MLEGKNTPGLALPPAALASVRSRLVRDAAVAKRALRLQADPLARRWRPQTKSTPRFTATLATFPNPSPTALYKVVASLLEVLGADVSAAAVAQAVSSAGKRVDIQEVLGASGLSDTQQLHPQSQQWPAL